MNVRDKKLNVWVVSVLAYLKILSRLSHEQTKDSITASGRITATWPKFGEFTNRVVVLPVEKVRKNLQNLCSLNRTTVLMKLLSVKNLFMGRRLNNLMETENGG